MTKGMAAMLVYTRKECSYKSIVIVHQLGGYDVTCKPRVVKGAFYYPYSGNRICGIEASSHLLEEHVSFDLYKKYNSLS